MSERRLPPRTSADRIRGCLVAGAAGDALGAPIEFDSLERIRQRHGDDGVSGFVEGAFPAGSVTDDTQMTVFTAEGLLQAAAAAAPHQLGPDVAIDHVRNAYLRWYRTQTDRFDPSAAADGLLAHAELWKARAPGNTCMSALRAGGQGTPGRPINGSKGCGGVMRAAPAGMVPALDPLELGAAVAALTHGHPSGYWSAGALAVIVSELIWRDGQRGDAMADAVQHAIGRLAALPASAGAGETIEALRAAVDLSVTGEPSPEALESLGSAWVGEEALAIAVACALGFDDPFDALCASVNHSGDSDSTGAICGNLLGAARGDGWLPAELADGLDVRTIVRDMARRLAETFVPRTVVDIME